MSHIGPYLFTNMTDGIGKIQKVVGLFSSLLHLTWNKTSVEEGNGIIEWELTEILHMHKLITIHKADDCKACFALIWALHYIVRIFHIPFKNFKLNLYMYNY